MEIDVRVRDIFAHLGVAIALKYAIQTIADIYKQQIGIQLPLPPYPGNLVQLVGAGMVH